MAPLDHAIMSGFRAPEAASTNLAADRRMPLTLRGLSRLRGIANVTR
jgi:hypothetical protein